MKVARSHAASLDAFTSTLADSRASLTSSWPRAAPRTTFYGEVDMPSSDAEFWNGRFASESYVFGTQPAAFLVDNAHYVPPRSRVLVPADGEGRNSVFLAELGHRVSATDIAEEGLSKARKLAAARGVSVEFRHLDLQGWRWPEAEFDAVVA